MSRDLHFGRSLDRSWIHKLTKGKKCLLRKKISLLDRTGRTHDHEIQFKPVSCRNQGLVDELQSSKLPYPLPRSYVSRSLPPPRPNSSLLFASKVNLGLILPHLPSIFNPRIALGPHHSELPYPRGPSYLSPPTLP